MTAKCASVPETIEDLSRSLDLADEHTAMLMEKIAKMEAALATAPAVFAALTEAVRLVDCYQFIAHQIPGADPNATARWYIEAKAAIAKATGVAP